MISDHDIEIDFLKKNDIFVVDFVTSMIFKTKGKAWHAWYVVIGVCVELVLASGKVRRNFKKKTNSS